MKEKLVIEVEVEEDREVDKKSPQTFGSVVIF